MFREMRRKDKQLSEDVINKILNNGKYGILATISENGYPYTTPLNYTFCKNKIYFHSAVDGEKIDNIKNGNEVSFCIIDGVDILPEKFTTNYNSIILFGKAEEVFEGEKEDALVALIEKYSEKFKEQGRKLIENAQKATRVFSIEIEHITGKFHK